jgi:hypothetical protein
MAFLIRKSRGTAIGRVCSCKLLLERVDVSVSIISIVRCIQVNRDRSSPFGKGMAVQDRIIQIIA